LFSVIFFFASCVDDYPTPGIPAKIGYLVVEGFINMKGTTMITLTHTMAIDDPYNIPFPELKAKVFVESEDMVSYSLVDKGKGVYSADNIPINDSKRYRIHITTASNKEYVSEYVEVKQTPVIESLTWNVDFVKKGIQIYVTTKDPDNKSRYYNWDYTETWQYRSYYPTHWEYNNGQEIWNPNREQIFNCWMIKRSASVYVTSTERLSQDVVNKFPVLFIPYTSEKLDAGYHIVVRQNAVTKDNYEYLSELKKVSETRGSLFDSQPSALTGNIRCISDSDEPVFGYVGAHGQEEKSIKISRIDLPTWFGPIRGECEFEPGLTRADINYYLKIGTYSLADTDRGTMPIAPIYRPTECIDCRKQGGTNKKPADWPY